MLIVSVHVALGVALAVDVKGAVNEGGEEPLPIAEELCVGTDEDEAVTDKALVGDGEADMRLETDGGAGGVGRLVCVPAITLADGDTLVELDALNTVVEDIVDVAHGELVVDAVVVCVVDTERAPVVDVIGELEMDEDTDAV